MPLEELAEAAQEIGIKSIEIINPDEWSVIAKYGLECGMSNGANLGIPNGFNEPDNHEELLRQYTEVIPKAAEAGVKQVICFSGNRRGMSDEVGLENCAAGLDPVIKLAEKHGVIISMELLNSKVDHKDYMCDHTAWGAALVEKVGSPNFKLLYDIYHMQIMEGDVIRTIRDNHQYISHYHTGGVPGRNEINDTQELYYPAIAKAIKDTGYTGFIAQEFIPKGPNPIESLEEGVHICDV
jgi:hydroxypyruvate isomerase